MYRCTASAVKSARSASACSKDQDPSAALRTISSLHVSPTLACSLSCYGDIPVTSSGATSGARRAPLARVRSHLQVLTNRLPTVDWEGLDFLLLPRDFCSSCSLVANLSPVQVSDRQSMTAAALSVSGADWLLVAAQPPVGPLEVSSPRLLRTSVMQHLFRSFLFFSSTMPSRSDQPLDPFPATCLVHLKPPSPSSSHCCL
jgi:hypothetical protein